MQYQAMKKIYIIAMALSSLILSSCENDDIMISSTINFTVDPSYLASSLSVAEVNPGDLEVLDKDCRLTVDLMIYNQNGELVESSTERFTNYDVKMKYAAKKVTEGSYTVLAISHIEDVSDNSTYWEIKNKQKLEGLQVVDAGYIGGQNKIFGMAYQVVNITGSSQDIQLKLTPVGSILRVEYYNIHNGWTIADKPITIFQLVTNKTSDSFVFSRTGEANVQADSSDDYAWRLDMLYDLDDYTVDNIYSYEYVLPMNNVRVLFRGYTDEEKYADFGSQYTFNFQSGTSYYAALDIANDESEFGKITSSSVAPRKGRQVRINHPKRLRSLPTYYNLKELKEAAHLQ